MVLLRWDHGVSWGCWWCALVVLVLQAYLPVSLASLSSFTPFFSSTYPTPYGYTLDPRIPPHGYHLQNPSILLIVKIYGQGFNLHKSWGYTLNLDQPALHRLTTAPLSYSLIAQNRGVVILVRGVYMSIYVCHLGCACRWVSVLCNVFIVCPAERTPEIEKYES